MEINEDILIKKAVAPRVTLQALEDNIIAEHYFTAYEGRMGSVVEGTYETIGVDAGSDLDLDSLKLLTFCVLVLKNGYTVHGVSACASPENFNAEVGKSIARQNAVGQIWPLMGYELKTKLMHQEQDSMGDAIHQLVAHSFGNSEALKPETSKIILNELIPQNVDSNHDIARIVHAGIRTWSQLQGDEASAHWDELADFQKEVWIDAVIYFRANPDEPENEDFDQKLIRSLVCAAVKPPLTPASKRKPVLKVVS